MTPALLALGTLVAIPLLVWLPLRWAFALFVATLVLVPDTLRFPLGGDQLLLSRLFPIVFLGGMILRVGRGEVRGDAFRPGTVTLGLAGFAVVAWVVGVLGADDMVPVAFSRDAWLLIPEQVVVLVASTAAVRTIGSVRAAMSIATAATAAGAIAVAEKVTRQGYAELLFEKLPAQRAGGSGAKLEVRSGSVRPRVAARFSLAFAWQSTMLLPLVAAAAVTSRRLWRALAVPLLLAAIALTSTRSAYLGVALGVGAFALLSRRRAVLVAVAALAVVGAVAVTATGTADDAFEAPEAQGSNAVRDERSPVVLEAAADDPFTGLGYGALLSRGLPGTDSSWLQLYAELGAVGLAAVALSITMAVAAMGPALTGTARHAPERTVAAACWAGVALSLVGGAFFDLFTGRQSVLPLWALAAVGAVAAEELAPGTPSPVRALGRRAALPLAGLVIGLLVLVLAPRPTAVRADLQLVPIATDAVAGAPGPYVGRTLGRTACTVFTGAAEAEGADAWCQLGFGRGPGDIRVRVTSESGTTARRAATRAADVLAERIRSAKVLAVQVDVDSLPSLVRTAPLTGAAVGLGVALLLPPPRRRRRAAVAASSTTDLRTLAWSG